MPLIKCENLRLSYENTTVLDGLSFEVSRGDYLCIVGENGSGKSTLVKAMLSLKAPAAGKIEYGDGLKRNEIGYLPQQSAAQKDFPAGVREVVLSGCLNRMGMRPFYSKHEKAMADENIKRLGITPFANKSFRELSGGQQQRVLLARALCAAKTLLLLDEPVAGLDPLVTAELYDLIKKLNREGMTVIMVTHDIPNAVKYSTHILHLHHTPLFFGKTSGYLNSDAGKSYAGGNSIDRNN
ncbi:MAG: metal ABC transporter ATP-binding protein [Firmicutes bacterium]|nr:metal ABC transporter ATP-binding protein [Bacillota bacterium]